MQNLMPPVNTPDNLFHDGDPTQGIEGTIVTAQFLNDDQSATRDVQAELINVLAAAAMEPDPNKQDQLVTAIQSIVTGAVPDVPVKSVNQKTGDVVLTAGDVAALPVAGGNMGGVITVNGEGHGSYASQNTNKAPLYQEINSTSTSEYWPMVKQKYIQGKSTWSVGRIVNTDDMVVHYLSEDDATGKNFSFKKDGTFVPANYANFDAKYQVKGSYTPAGQAYTKAESDGRYQAKGNYTPAGQAYTKAESDGRYPLKTATVIGARVGARGTIGSDSGASDIDAPVGNFITGRVGSNGDVRYGRWYIRALQINVNGTWKTITA